VILTLLNAYVAKFKPEAFATALVAVIDSAGGVLRYAIAGHPPAVLVDADGSAELLTEPLGPPLGLAGSRYGEGERLLAPGSALIRYSDGLVERRLTSLEETIADLVQSASGKYAATAEEICDRVTGRLLSGVELFDDACVLVAMRPRLTRPSATG
jgi:serine phosphatase RsbU (regulator of sigma subunit)